MSFMEHEITNKQAWYQVEGNCCTDYIPAELVNTRITFQVGRVVDSSYPRVFASLCAALKDYTENSQIDEVTMIEGYGARLSAPGYLDCTEWAVFDTPEEAQAYLDESYPDDDEEEEED